MAFWDDMALCAEAEAEVGLICTGDPCIIFIVLYWFLVRDPVIAIASCLFRTAADYWILGLSCQIELQLNSHKLPGLPK